MVLPGKPPSLTEKPGRPQFTGSQSRTQPKQLSMHKCKTFFSPWQLCPSESWVWRWLSCLARRDPGGIKCAGTRTASAAGVMALSVFFGAPCSWWSEGLLGQGFSVAPPIQALGGLPYLGSYSVVQCLRCLMGQPLYGSAADAGS